MALVLADRVKETTTTTGTGTVTLLGASTGYQSFAAVGNANTTYYTIAGQTTSEWEVGIGTYTSVGTTLSRTTVLSSSNGGSLVTFSSGTKDVFVTYPSSRSIYADGAVLTATNSSVLPVSSGGTGVTTSTGSGSNVLSTSPTLVTPALGTPSALVGTNITGTATAFTASNVTTNANLTGDVTSVGNATTLTNAPVIAKVLTGYVSGAGTVAASDSILQAIQKLNGNDATNANLTGPITSTGNATAIAAQTGTGTTFVMQDSPSLTTPALGTPSSGTLTNCTFPTLNQNTTGTAANVTGTVAVANGGTGNTTGYNLFAVAFTSSINANTDRTAGSYGSYASAATNTPTTAGILYNFLSGTGGAGDGGQFWQDYVTNNLYLRQRWGGTYGSWLTVLSSNNYNSYAPTLTGTGASGTWGISISGNAATATSVTGTVAVGNGGTGATSLTANNVLLGNGTSAVQVVAPGTSGNVLTSDGTTWASTAAAGVPSTTTNVTTASASVTLTLDTTTYKRFQIKVTGMNISGNNGSFSTVGLRFYDSGGNAPSIIYWGNQSNSPGSAWTGSPASGSTNAVQIGASYTLITPSSGVFYAQAFSADITIDFYNSKGFFMRSHGSGATSGTAGSNYVAVASGNFSSLNLASVQLYYTNGFNLYGQFTVYKFA